MLRLDRLDNNIIDLDGIKEFKESFVVISENDKGKRQPFFIDLVSSNSIKVERYNGNEVLINIDVPSVIENEYIFMKNIIGDTLLLTIKPNPYFVADRIYKFKLTKAEEKQDGSLRIKILSKVNGEEMSWKCTYNGKPINYTITPIESEKSEFVSIKVNDTIINDFMTKLIFTQDESLNNIYIDILNTSNGLKILS